MASARRAWARAVVRWPAAIGLAIALGAYLTLADLQTAEQDGGSNLYVAIAAVGIAVLIIGVGWHGVWLMPLTTVGFAAIYEAHFWTRPPGIGQGIDYLAYHPTSVGLLLVFAVPYATAIATIRTVLAQRLRP
jgi:hypothetical protein